MTNRAIIYARVSTDDQADGYSLYTQLDECQKHAQNAGLTVIGEFCEDYTGTVLDRPEMDKIARLASDGAFDRLIVLEMDRLARGMALTIILEADFKKKGVTVEYVLTPFDDSPEGRLQKHIRATVAEYEREKILQRMARGARGRVKAGYILPGYLPSYGYRYISEDHKGNYEIVEHEAKIVRWIFEWYVLGDETGKRLGTQAIASKLSAMRIPTRADDVLQYRKKRGRGVWAKRSINNILKNETYAGVWHYNKTRRDPTNGKRHIAQPRSEWIAVQVPPIVSRELWEAAQAQMTANTINSPRNTKAPYLMRGRLYCDTCGHMFNLNTDNRWRKCLYYVCAGQKTYNSVDGDTITCRHSLRAERLDANIWGAIKWALQNPQLVLDHMQHVRAESEAALIVKRSRLATIDSEIAQSQDKRNALLDEYLERRYTRAELDAKHDEITHKIAGFEAERERLAGQIADAEISEARIEAVHQFCAMQRGLEHFEFEDRRNVIEALDVTGVVIRGETPDDDTIILTGYFPDIVVNSNGDVAFMTPGYGERKAAFSIVLRDNLIL